jgi:hypothetical protein
MEVFMMGEKNKFKGVVLPGDPNKGGGPTFDKVAAYYLFLTANGLRDENLSVEFYGSSEPKDNRVKELVEQGFFPIDVAGYKYQQQKKGSAAEVVALRFKLTNDPRVDELVIICNNNNKTGYLKGFAQSLVWALREAYKVERDPRLVVRQTLVAVDVFFQLYGKSKDDPSWKKRSWKEEKGLFKTLENIPPQLKDYNLFTLSWLVRGMFELGYPMKAVRDTALWWLRVFNAAEKAKAKAVGQLDQKFRREFEVKGLSGCAIYTDDQQLGRLLIREQGYAVVVIVRSSGNVAILTNETLRPNMAEVAKILNREDSKIHGREVWFFDPNKRMQCVLNGSVNWAQQPTSLTLDGITKIIQANARFYTKKF